MKYNKYILKKWSTNTGKWLIIQIIGIYIFYLIYVGYYIPSRKFMFNVNPTMFRIVFFSEKLQRKSAYQI